MDFLFYTNVERYGNTILWRGYENGKPFMRREQHRPTLYLPNKEGNYRSLLENRPISKRQFESMSEAKEFIERLEELAKKNREFSQTLDEKAKKTFEDIVLQLNPKDLKEYYDVQ